MHAFEFPSKFLTILVALLATLLVNVPAAAEEGQANDGESFIDTPIDFSEVEEVEEVSASSFPSEFIYCSSIRSQGNDGDVVTREILEIICFDTTRVNSQTVEESFHIQVDASGGETPTMRGEYCLNPRSNPDCSAMTAGMATQILGALVYDAWVEFRGPQIESRPPPPYRSRPTPPWWRMVDTTELPETGWAWGDPMLQREQRPVRFWSMSRGSFHLWGSSCDYSSRRSIDEFGHPTTSFDNVACTYWSDMDGFVEVSTRGYYSSETLDRSAEGQRCVRREWSSDDRTCSDVAADQAGWILAWNAYELYQRWSVEQYGHLDNVPYDRRPTPVVTH